MTKSHIRGSTTLSSQIEERIGIENIANFQLFVENLKYPNDLESLEKLAKIISDISPYKNIIGKTIDALLTNITILQDLQLQGFNLLDIIKVANNLSPRYFGSINYLYTNASDLHELQRKIHPINLLHILSDSRLSLENLPVALKLIEENCLILQEIGAYFNTELSLEIDPENIAIFAQKLLKIKEEIIERRKPEVALMEFFDFKPITGLSYKDADRTRLETMLNKISGGLFSNEKLIFSLHNYIEKLYNIKQNLSLNAETIFAILDGSKGDFGKEIDYLYKMSVNRIDSLAITNALYKIPAELTALMLRGSGKNFYSPDFGYNISAIDNIANNKELIMDLLVKYPEFYKPPLDPSQPPKISKDNFSANTTEKDFNRLLLYWESRLEGRLFKDEIHAFRIKKIHEVNSKSKKDLESESEKPARTITISFAKKTNLDEPIHPI